MAIDLAELTALELNRVPILPSETRGETQGSRISTPGLLQKVGIGYVHMAEFSTPTCFVVAAIDGWSCDLSMWARPDPPTHNSSQRVFSLKRVYYVRCP